VSGARSVDGASSVTVSAADVCGSLGTGRAGHGSGVAVVVRGVAAEPIALPLTPAACLALAADVLAAAGSDGDAGATKGAVAIDDPALAVWLGGTDQRGAGLLQALGRDLVAVGAPAATLPRGTEWSPERIAWETFAAALRARGGGTENVRDWGRQLRTRISAGGLAALPVAPRTDALSIEGVVLGRALDLAGRHARVADGLAAEVEAARLEGLRALAYGAGHEINNPLANIAARGQALLVDETDPRRRRRLVTIVDQAFRARDMIGALMLFGRPPQPRFTECDVATIVSAAVAAVAARGAERGVTIVAPPAAGVVAWADRTLVEESLRAVLVNAIDAMPGGGRVVIGIDREPARHGRELAVIVDDEGPGMDAETRRAALDPFYSGREAGRGIGFGLTKAGRFVAACAGELSLGTAPGGGTRVTLRLGVPEVADPAVQPPQTTRSDGQRAR